VHHAAATALQGRNKLKKDLFKIGNLNDTEHLKWDVLSSEHVMHTAIFDIEKSLRESKKGVTAPFFSLKAPNWVTIIPWYRNDEGVPCFVMVQQFRHGSQSIIREFPAGMVDDGEDALVAATRELSEETGIVSKDITHLATVNPNPAFMDNKATFFLAKDIIKSENQKLDTTEVLDVLSVPVTEVIEKMGTDELYDNGVMMMALSFFLRQAAKDSTLLN
jgi:8-oxo-dGTP pyrophosphatase MutT (NUDIX family)